MQTILFQNETLQQQFERDGYVVVPFLNAEEVQQITRLYEASVKEHPQGFHSTSFYQDDVLKEKITKEVEQIYASKIADTFTAIQKLGSSFLTKAPGDAGRMPVHADWTVVDETKYCSVTMWVPLIDLTDTNGAIKVLPGSHKFSDALRAPTLPVSFRGSEDVLEMEMVTLNMKAGEAFIFNQAVLHASNANTTAVPRVAITYGLIPAEASLCLYHQSETGKLEKWKMPLDMFQRYTNIGQRPLFGEKETEFDYTVRPETTASIRQKINNYKRQLNKKTMKPLFLDKAIQKQFEEDGYVILPALNENEIKELTDFYFNTSLTESGYGSYGNGFKVGMDNKDKDLVNEMMEKIIDVALPKVQEHMFDAQVFTASYVVKEPNPMSIVPVHQDWSFVDNEDEYCSATCWIPLVDVTEDNGALGVVRGSNNYYDAIRCSPSPQAPHALADHYFTTFPFVKLIEMKAGQAIVFNNKTFHASPPNLTKETRLAVGLGFAQREAKTVHYFLKPDGNKNKLLKYAIDRDFFKKYDNAKLGAMYDRGEVITDYPLLGEVDYHYQTFTQEEITQMMTNSGAEFNMELCQKLADIFGYNLDGSKKEEVVEAVAAPATEDSQPAASVEPNPSVWIDNRSFLEKYTPANIITELKKKLLSN